MSLDTFINHISQHTHFPKEKITISSSFRDDLGIDSLQLVNLIFQLCEHYDVNLNSLQSFNDISHVGNMYQLFHKESQSKGTFYDWIFNIEETEKHKIVLVSVHHEYSLKNIENETKRYMSMLNQEGSLNGRKVGVLIPNVYHFLSILFAINKLGGTVVPLSWQYRSKDLIDVIDFINPDIILSISKFNNFHFDHAINKWAESTKLNTTTFYTHNYQEWNREQFEGKERPIEKKRIDLICCTSGSTGIPKGIVLNCNRYRYWLDWCDLVGNLKTNDRVMSTVPVTSSYGLSWVLTTLKNRNVMVMHESLDLPEMVDLFQRNKCNKFFSTPSIFKAFYQFSMQRNLDLSKDLDLCGLAGEIITEEYMSSFSHFNSTKFIGIFGTSESGGIMYNLDLRANLDWTIWDQIEWKLEPINELLDEGELVVRFPGAFKEYYNQPVLTDELLDAEGWFRTGDIVKLKKNGAIEVIGRQKDMIKKGGQQVVPGEIEKVLANHDLINEVVVVGCPHKVYGEQIVAFVTVKKEIDVNELYLYCSQLIAGYKLPDLIKVIDKFPISQGKIDKVSLRNNIVGE